MDSYSYKEEMGFETRYISIGIITTIIFHFSFILFFHFVEKDINAVEITLPSWEKVCVDNRRCIWKPVRILTRDLDTPPFAIPSIIEATIVPRLGFASETPHKLPKLLKYEQPEKVEDAVNIKETPKKEEKLIKAPDAKKAELDKTRKKKESLSDILQAPQEDDERLRAATLDKIIGSPEGSVYGYGSDVIKGNIYAGKVALAIREVFTIPPFISNGELIKLFVRVKIIKMTEKGEVLEFEVLENSSNSVYNSSAISAIKRFSPKDGGDYKLPSPDSETLQYINKYGMIIDLDGKLMKR